MLVVNRAPALRIRRLMRSSSVISVSYTHLHRRWQSDPKESTETSGGRGQRPPRRLRLRACGSSKPPQMCIRDRRMAELSAVEAINLDGGKTSCLLFIGTKISIANPDGLVRDGRSAVSYTHLASAAPPKASAHPSRPMRSPARCRARSACRAARPCPSPGPRGPAPSARRLSLIHISPPRNG